MTPGVRADCVQAYKATGGLGKGAKSTILMHEPSQYPFRDYPGRYNGISLSAGASGLFARRAG